MRSFYWSIILCLACPGASASSTNAWERTDLYVAPHFNAYFPLDSKAGQHLTYFEKNGKLNSLPPEELIPVVQQGLRTTPSHKLSILRTLGNRFIWGKSPQNPEAIELMYHAAGCPTNPDPQGTSHNAVYFGLSVVQSKTPNILRTLVDLCMESNDPNILSRVAWGIDSQRGECLEFLKPYLTSPEDAVRSKADVVERILNQKLQAFEWAREESRKLAEANYRGELPDIKRALAEGSSEERKRTMEKISRGGIVLIMDDTFIPAFAACARDADAGTRRNAAITVGGNWIWHAKQQSPEAIRLMLQLSQDPDNEVRYAAVYYGLSTVRGKSDEVIRRLVEMHVKDGEGNNRSRIEWGLSSGPNEERDKTASILAEYLNDPDPKVVAEAAAWYRGLTHNPSPGITGVSTAKSMDTNAMAEIRMRLEPAFRPFVLKLADGQELLLSTRDNVALGKNLLVIVEAQDYVRTIDLRQIAAIQDLPAPPNKTEP
jgi:hypothetical protein